MCILRWQLCSTQTPRKNLVCHPILACQSSDPSQTYAMNYLQCTEVSACPKLKSTTGWWLSRKAYQVYMTLIILGKRMKRTWHTSGWEITTEGFFLTGIQVLFHAWCRCTVKHSDHIDKKWVCVVSIFQLLFDPLLYNWQLHKR